ncbi:MAG: GntR family transcriptional regulator [Bacteroidota bacterium]
MGIDLRSHLPLYRQIADDLQGQITSGALAVDARLGSHRELSQQYGVSLITIKKALSELIREGYLYARAGKGTFVARRATPVNHNEHRSIGLVLREIQIPFFSAIVQQAEAYAYEAGYNILLSMSGGRPEKEEKQIEHFQRIGVDGLIIASLSTDRHAAPAIRALHEAQFPYVMVSYVEDPDIHFVGVDNEAGGYLAAQHLVERGYTRMGYVGTPSGNKLSAVREAGFRRALQDHGLAVDPAFVYTPLTGPGWKRYEAGYAFGLELATHQRRPDALFVYNDVSALGVQRGLLERGLRVPDDLALVGFDDIEQAAVAPVPITSVKQPTDEIARRAIASILARIQRQPVTPYEILPPELSERASTGSLAPAPLPADASALRIS